jgi:hypothetical protein
MPYIGRQSGDTGQYIRCNTITPDGSTTTFALTNVLDNSAVTPGTVNNVLCSLSGVIQAPSSAFTLSTSNIVFSAAPDAADVVDFIIVLGDTVVQGTPSDNTVDTIQIVDDAVTIAKLNLTYDASTTATGDGSTVAFTINSNRTVHDVLVIVNGITFVPTDDYTISGTTLTFVAAPIAAAEIQVRYLPK